MKTNEPTNQGMHSFMNVPVVTDLDELQADIAFIGIPYGTPYVMDHSPIWAAPGYLREVSARFVNSLGPGYNFDFDGELLDGHDVRIVDCGDVPGNPLDVAGTVLDGSRAVQAILDAGAVPIVFGGDDSVPIPVVRAYETHGPITVIQIDQHLDFKQERHGVTEGYSSPMRRISEMVWVERIFQIGQHGIGSALTSDLQDALAAGNTIVTEREVHERGIGSVLERIPDGLDYFITVDFDGLDPSIAPAVSHPEPGGLTFHEASDLLCGLARKGRVVGMDMVEFVPAHDLHGLGGRTAGRLILNLIAAMVRAGQFD